MQSSQTVPRKKSKAKWVVVGVVIIIVIIIAIFAIPSLTGSNSVNVTAVDMSVVYQGISSGYIGPTSQSISGFTSTVGSGFSYSITFTSSALFLNHQITSIYTTTSGFSISSFSPNLPYTFSSGSTFTITVNFQMPTSSYNGVLQLVIDTS